MNARENNLLFMEKIENVIPPKTIDVFVLAASVDSRSYAVFESFVSKGIIINKVIILDYEKFRPTTNDFQKYHDYYKLQGLNNVEYIRCDEDGADGRYISKIKLPFNPTVLIDITSISIPDLFRLFYVIKEFLDVPLINVVYAEPKYYDYLNGFYFEYEKGIVERDYRTLAEYFTSAVSRDVILVCFLGFERLVSKYIHERNEHSDVVVINGFPAYYPKLKDISLEHNYELISTMGTDCIRYAQANNPFSAFNTLTAIKEKHSDELLDICVLGSKPMALGACMFALKNPDSVKVSYPFPKEHQMHTSIDVSDVWFYKISL